MDKLMLCHLACNSIHKDIAGAIMIDIMLLTAYPNTKETKTTHASSVLSVSLKEVDNKIYCCFDSKNDKVLVELTPVYRIEDQSNTTYPMMHRDCYRCLARNLIR